MRSSNAPRIPRACAQRTPRAAWSRRVPRGEAPHTRAGPREELRDLAASGKPLIGLCLGMQLLLDGSDELGGDTGLG